VPISKLEGELLYRDDMKNLVQCTNRETGREPGRRKRDDFDVLPGHGSVVINPAHNSGTSTVIAVRVDSSDLDFF
jgi:hypothetical protein